LLCSWYVLHIAVENTVITARLNDEIGDDVTDAGALPPAKASLARAVATVKRTQDELEAAQKPVDRLAHARAAATLGEAAELRSEIARLRAAHEAEINLWVDAGGVGKRPAPSPDLIPLERALGSIAAAAREAEARFPPAHGTLLSAADRVRNALAERERAMWPATVEAADRTVDELDRAITAAQSAEARLLSLVSALREAAVRAGDNENGAMAAAAKIEERIITTRRRGAPRVYPAHGRSLIERLRSDPSAEL
jgi:hypothetical protein